MSDSGKVICILLVVAGIILIGLVTSKPDIQEDLNPDIQEDLDKVKSEIADLKVAFKALQSQVTEHNNKPEWWEGE